MSKIFSIFLSIILSIFQNIRYFGKQIGNKPEQFPDSSCHKNAETRTFFDRRTGKNKQYVQNFDRKPKISAKKFAKSKIIIIFASRNDTYYIIYTSSIQTIFVYEKTTQESACFGLRCA